MSGRIASRLIIPAAFALIMLATANLAAQVSPHLPINSNPQNPNTNTNGNHPNHAAAERNPSCQKIVNECKNLGFIVGEWKQDNGLWKDCFDPVVHGGQATRDGKSIQVPVSSSDVQTCRGATSGGNNRTQNQTRPTMH